MFGVSLDGPFGPENGTPATSWEALLVVFMVEKGTVAVLPDLAAYVAEFGFADTAGMISLESDWQCRWL